MSLNNYEISLMLTWGTDFLISCVIGSTKFETTDKKY